MSGKETSAVSEEMPTGTERILMVDDEEIAIGLGSRLLRELGEMDAEPGKDGW